MATNPNTSSLTRAGATINQLRHEIDECRAMLRHVEELLRRHRSTRRRS